MSHAKPRLAVDLDEIERQLAHGAPAPAAPAPRRADPLAELAQIVGQDDPFRSLLAPAEARRAVASQPAIAAAAPEPAMPVQAQVAPRAPAPPYVEPRYDDASADYHLLTDDPPPARRSRKGLVAVGAVMGVAVCGVAGAMLMRAGDRAATGPVIVQAERTPLKVQPQNPGGVVVPDQNRQIYQPGQGEGQIKVVNREEQPVDVRSAAAAAAPAPGATASALIGEPKKVRTVSVRPDGTIVTPTPPERPAGPATTGAVRAPAAPPAAPSQPTTTAAIPAASTPAAPATQPPRRPQGEARTAASPAPAPRPQTAEPTPAPARQAAVASPAEPAAAGRGNFVVQLSSSPSEADAKAKAGQLKTKLADALGGRAPHVRSAEVNGSTTYRVRVGPMSRDDANALCGRVKGTGGACIVAAN